MKYQKRSLPYIHLPIFLNLADKFLEVYYIDKVICAKLPIIESDPTGELTKIVTLVMIYSLYDNMNFYLFCMSNA